MPDGPEASLIADETAATPGGYRVLARKYRPTHFGELIGQDPMVRTLRNAFAQGRIPQAWMLTGVRGVGKTTTARILARALNYEREGEPRAPTVDFTDPGIHCQAIMEGRHVDVIEMDAASHTGIDNIREITDAARYKPVSALYKVYIIDEVHMLSTAAFNGLLKTLEEPPAHVKFIFATTEIRKVPVTVLSRCQRFDLRRIEEVRLADHLAAVCAKESVSVEREALAMVARAAEGSVRDALSILDQAIAHGAGTVAADALRDMLGLADRSRVLDLFELIMKGEAAGALAEFAAQMEAGADPVVVLNDLAAFVHQVTRLKVTNAAPDPAEPEAVRERSAEFAERLGVAALSRMWQALLAGISEVQTAPRPATAAEMLLVRLTYMASLPEPDRLALSAAPGSAGLSASPSAPGARASQGATGAAEPASVTSSVSRAAEAPPAHGASGDNWRPSLARPSPEPPSLPKTPSLPEAPSSPEPPSLTEPMTGSPPVQLMSPNPPRPPKSLEDVASLVAGNVLLKRAVERHMRLKKIDPGRLEVTLDPAADRDVAGD
ncbi:MAG: DNA polymerase III subunit gamma/tau, partial [Pseudomonadota bacterium]